MYLHNNYVCHFLQDYWKELVITAIKSKHNSASVVSCWWKVDCVYLYSSSFRFMIYEFCHCISYELFFGPSKTEDKPPKIIKFYLEYLLIFKVAFPGGWGCIPVLLSLLSVSVQPIVSLCIHPGLGPVSMEWQSVDRKLRKFKMWNIDQSRGRSPDRPGSVTCWLDSREETKYRNTETFLKFQKLVPSPIRTFVKGVTLSQIGKVF